ncbi:hypothetical protein GE300_19555 [Rhodobacteraceae bacterium 2CG4]|uniref:Flagellar motor switch protein FliG n=1 Tax=Halovulum marinum TaxID=2662447 RepID=A0A6L5Z5C5_9RHOB|nr:FliG C-terminal domain-containing protein [Halovulum marinum]MSU91776.1 hypothetical protein [Halovulum marinum]
MTGAAAVSSPPALVEPWDTLRQKAQAGAAELPPIRKAAIILAAIGPEAAGEFLRTMDEGALTRTAIEISRLDRVPKDMLDAVIAEFLLSIGTDEEVSGGSHTARRLLAEVLDDKTIERIMLDVTGGPTRSAWKRLNECSNTALASFVGAEHPQTAAVILTELRPDKAAAVVERLDPEFAQQTVLRMARVPALEPRVAAMVESVIASDFLSALQRTQGSRRPAELIAGLMNNLRTEAREKFLGYLEDEKPTLHRDVLRTMFTFADIRERVAARDVPLLIKELEEPVLIVALKWGQMQGNPSVDFLLSNLSKRLSERLVEDLAGVPEPTQRDGEGAHQEVVRVIQEMAKVGSIALVEDEVPEE